MSYVFAAAFMLNAAGAVAILRRAARTQRSLRCYLDVVRSRLDSNPPEKDKPFLLGEKARVGPAIRAMAKLMVVLNAWAVFNVVMAAELIAWSGTR